MHKISYIKKTIFKKFGLILNHRTSFVEFKLRIVKKPFRHGCTLDFELYIRDENGVINFIEEIILISQEPSFL